MCSLVSSDNVHFQKYPYSPHRRDWNFLGGWRVVGGFCKTKTFKEMYEAYLEFPEGWGVLDNIPSVGKVWVFSGTTQCIKSGFQRFPNLYLTYQTSVL